MGKLWKLLVSEITNVILQHEVCEYRKIILVVDTVLHSNSAVTCSKNISEEGVGSSVMDNYCGSKDFCTISFSMPSAVRHCFIRWTVILYFDSYLTSGKDSITILECIYQIWGLILIITSLVMCLLFCRDQLSHCWFIHVWVKPDSFPLLWDEEGIVLL